MHRRQIDPSLLEGDELERWYRRSSGEIEAERDTVRQDRYDTFFGPTREGRFGEAAGGSGADLQSHGQGRTRGWREARVAIRPSGLAARPGGVRIGLSPAIVDSPGVASRGGFFDTYPAIPNPAQGPAYITDLPRPLDFVTPRVGQWYELGDGTLVEGAAEIERLHAEQQRRMRGDQGQAPAARVRSVDRLRDGFIPRADQVAKGQREDDATCHPFGGWEHDPGFPTNPERSRRYETQITRAPGLDYVVRNLGDKAVKFDGCAVWDPRSQLLEAKGPGYAGLAERGGRSNFFRALVGGLRSQANRQVGAARGRAVEWHVAEPGAMPLFTDALERQPSIRLRNTPAR